MMTGTEGRSRRRGDRLLAQIYAATLTELADHGYAGVTMAGVAARAGTGKGPLYRRWPGKDALIADTVRHGLPATSSPGYSGDVRADLLGLLRQLADGLASPGGGAMRALLGETHRRPELMSALREKVFEPRGQALRALLREAAAAGEIHPAAVETHLADLGHRLLMFRFLTEGAPIPDHIIIEILDDVLLPLLRAEPHVPGPWSPSKDPSTPAHPDTPRP
ncbi:TetR/AcrR family transcriptional regulator [Actinomadura fulvescens]|uniref:TetR/AcrR family transcriptional regulator n=1 Tax=Actinomadura fulvescens TaxID=46160 RepID=A0ABN3QGM6_9ACTN